MELMKRALNCLKKVLIFRDFFIQEELISSVFRVFPESLILHSPPATLHPQPPPHPLTPTRESARAGISLLL